MLAIYINNVTNEPIVSVHTGHAPIKGDIVTIDTIKPSNPIKYKVMNSEHIIQIPEKPIPPKIVEASVDTYKIYVIPWSL
jgi:hypothetical protein